MSCEQHPSQVVIVILLHRLKKSSRSADKLWTLGLMILASARRRCPDCNRVLEQAAVPAGSRRSRGAVRCQLIAEPTMLSALHVARWCKACARTNFGCKTRFWCGFYETALPGKPGACSKSIDVGFEDGLYFMLNKSFRRGAYMAAAMEVSDVPS